MTLTIPAPLVVACRGVAEREAWLRRLPQAVRDIERRWSLVVDAPFEGEWGSCAWVAPVTRADGTHAVLKLGMPHFEGEHEALGLRFWNGDPTVRLLDADEDREAMLLERCEPGTTLRDLPALEQDAIVAQLLRRLWRVPDRPSDFRPLSAMTAQWSAETLQQTTRWRDGGLVRQGVLLFEQLSQPAPTGVLLATDLHAGNILRAQREPWLVIDPKPFVGDRAYDATQHLLNDVERLQANPHETIRRFADLADLDHERVRSWLFARAAAEPRDDWADGRLTALARVLDRDTR